jgi:subtilisin family serine protease
MNRSVQFTLSLFLTLIIIITSWAQTDQAAYQTGVIHIKLKKEYAPDESSMNRVTSFAIEPVDQAIMGLEGATVRRLFRYAGKFEKAHRHYGLHLWYNVEFDKSLPVEDALNRFINLEEVEIAERVQKVMPIEPDGPLLAIDTKGSQHGRKHKDTNDPLFGLQWHYENTGQTGGTPGADIKLKQAWNIETGKPNVIVAILDGMVDHQHPDLKDAMWVNTNEIPGNGIDDDNNGYIDDIHGHNFGQYLDEHGTHVAGTVGAVTNNGIGVSGIAGGTGTGNGVRLMSLGIFGNSFESATIEGMVYAADNGAVISQNSWRGGSPAIEAAINYFIARAGYDNTEENFDKNIQVGPMAGGLVIFAAANDNTENTISGYPAPLPQVIAVAALNHENRRANFSNYGTWVDIAAPGVDVLSTTLSQPQYGLYSGTSMACPHVSGVAALIISKFGGPGYTPEQVKNRLLYSTDYIDHLNEPFAGKLGTGALNAFLALQPEDDTPPSAITNLAVKETHFNRVTLQWIATGSSGLEGRAGRYDLRYSTTPINESNFTEASPIPNVPYPANSGMNQEMAITDLLFNAHYYFALKAIDMFGNQSALSNIVSATTAVKPAINVQPALLTEELLNGQASLHYVSLTNLESNELDIRLIFKPESKPEAAYRGKLFIADINSNSIFELNPEDGSIINSTPAPATNFLTFDGTFLFVSDVKNIYQIIPGSGDIIAVFSVDGYISSLAHYDKYLYAKVSSINFSGPPQLYEIDFEELKVVQKINLGFPHAYNTPTGGGSRGTMFFFYEKNYMDWGINEVDLKTGSVLHTFNVFGHPNSRLTYSDASGLLFVSDNSLIRAYNPNNGELVYFFVLSNELCSNCPMASDGYGWLSIPPVKLKVSAGQSVEIPVTLSAQHTPSGIYTGKLVAVADFTTIPLAEAHVTLTITDAPHIKSIRQKIDFSPAYINHPKQAEFRLLNIGSEPLEISALTVEGEKFSLPFEPFQIKSSR